MKWTPVIAMVCITTLEAIALILEVDGATLGIVIAALAALGGFELKAYIDKQREGKK